MAHIAITRHQLQSMGQYFGRELHRTTPTPHGPATSTAYLLFRTAKKLRDQLTPNSTIEQIEDVTTAMTAVRNWMDSNGFE